MDYSKLIEKFISDFCEPEDEVLKEIRRDTEIRQIHPRMISGCYQASLLSFLVKISKAKRILEIGTFTGYSAICMARALNEDGKILTIEKNDELESTIKKNILLAGLQDKIELQIGDALKIIPALNDNSFDIIFIDGDKREYADYYKLSLKKLETHGFIIIDNVLWNNKIFSEPASNDYMTKGIINFNNHIKNDNEVEKLILPVRDGLMIIRKK